MLNMHSNLFEIRSARLQIRRFEMVDAEDVFRCVTPAITRFMTWEPPSWDDYLARCERRLRDVDAKGISLVVRSLVTADCLGAVAIDGTDDILPELGIWLKESVHGRGFGREAIAAVGNWACRYLEKCSFIYPVAFDNHPSRRIAESFQGVIIGYRTGPKYETVVYRLEFHR